MWPSVALGGALGISCVWAGLLCWYDFTARRLPDYLTLPAAGGAFIGALIADPWALLGLVWAVGYVLISLAMGGVGGGDIKLALSLGIVVCAAAGLGGVLAAMVLAAGFSVLAALALRQPAVPHGPAMVAASVTAVLVLA